MSKQETPVAEGQLNKKDGSAVTVYHKSCQCYFRIETLDLIFIEELDAASFDEVMSKLSELVDKHHEAKKNLLQAFETYGNKLKNISEAASLDNYKKDISECEKKLDSAKRALLAELGEFDETNGYGPVIELIPIEPLKKGVYGRLYSYIKKSDFDVFLQAGKLNIIGLSTISGDDIFQKDDTGNITGIDVKALREKVTKAQDTIKEMMDKTMKADAHIDYETTLTDWATAWNTLPGYNKEGRYLDVSAGAQFLRLTANASAAGSWDPDSGEAKIKGEAHSEFTVFSGQVNATLFVPDKIGWCLKFMVNDTKEANLGILRAKIETGLTGYIGASAQIEGNLQFVTYNKKQMLMGCRTDTSRFATRQKGVKIKEGEEKPEVLDVKAEVFGGAKVGASLGGALQWLKPFDSLVDSLPDMLKTVGFDPKMAERILLPQKEVENKEAYLGKFTDFASFSLAGELELGAGASGEFNVSFSKGRFKFHMSGGLCLGSGAKGDVQGEISPQMFGEFAIWAVYQLYGIDYKHLKIIGDEAFKALTYMLVMGGVNVYKEYYKAALAEFRDVIDDFKGFTQKTMSEFKKARKESTERNNFAESINKNPGGVYLLTPEGKGISLFLLTGDGVYDRVDINNQGDWILADTGTYRKKAVLLILSSIQTKREWKKVLSRITKYGMPIPGDEDAIVKQQEIMLREFLQIGFNRDKEMDVIIDKLNLRDFGELVARLKNNPTYGYPFSPNCTKQYAMHCNDNPFYSSLCYFTPVNSDTVYKQKWEENK
ncbi:hypothetical protein EH227_00010 [Rouxiella chamberiensis]|nr:hypothetical protein EH227_00010 [Rouxiella chamberiensis]